MTFRALFLVPCFALLAACVTTSPAPPALPVPANLDVHKATLYRYYDSGRYDADVEALFADAAAYISGRSGQVRKPAIVLDIDETSLSNWPELQANGLTFKLDGPCRNLPKGPCGLKAWQQLGRAEAIAPALELARAAQAEGIAVFFITGRDETLRRATEANLRRAGFDGWQRLIMRPAGSTTPSAADYKAPQRALIEQDGYTILATIGDQPSDLAGGYAERRFLVPNPYYRIP